MFYNPMQLPGMAELSTCGGYYHRAMVRTTKQVGEAAASARRTSGSSIRRRADAPDSIHSIFLCHFGFCGHIWRILVGGRTYVALLVF